MYPINGNWWRNPFQSVHCAAGCFWLGRPHSIEKKAGPPQRTGNWFDKHYEDAPLTDTLTSHWRQCQTGKVMKRAEWPAALHHAANYFFRRQPAMNIPFPSKSCGQIVIVGDEVTSLKFFFGNFSCATFNISALKSKPCVAKFSNLPVPQPKSKISEKVLFLKNDFKKCLSCASIYFP